MNPDYKQVVGMPDEQPDVMLEDLEGGDLLIQIKGGTDDIPRAIRLLVQTIAHLEAASRPVMH